MKKYLGIGIALIAMLAASCSNDEAGLTPVEGKASMTIQLQGETTKTRSIGMPAEAAESNIHDVGVYIFNAAGQLQRFQYFGEKLTSQKIENLTTGPKTVVILSNFGESNYPTVASYNGLKAARISLDAIPANSTELASKGLPMSGEEEVTLLENEGVDDSNKVTVTLSRLVAKVRLASVTIQDPSQDFIPVNLKSVGIMKAVSEVGVVNADVASTPTYFKGYEDGTGVLKTYLQEGLTNNYGAPASTGTIYFYLLPYGADDDHATLMTLMSENGEPLTTKYFPIVINQTGSNGNIYLQRNSQYALHVTLKHHDTGTTTPEEIIKDASVEVTVEVEPWATEIEQDVIWE